MSFEPLGNLLTFMSVGGMMEGTSYKLVWPLHITAEPDKKTTYGDTNPTKPANDQDRSVVINITGAGGC